MASTIKHRTQSLVVDLGVAGQIGPAAWDDSHLIAGASGDGQFMFSRAALTDGWDFSGNFSGPYAIGGATNTRHGLNLAGSFTAAGGGANTGAQFDQALTNSAAVPLYGLRLAQTLTNVSGATTEMAWLHIVPSAITITAGSVTSAAALKIDAAPTGATNNYALWMAGGNVRLANITYLTWATNPLTTGPSVYGDTTQLALIGGAAGTSGIAFYKGDAATQIMRLLDSGILLLGTTVATGLGAGEMGLANAKYYQALNVGGTAHIALIGVNASNQVSIDVSANGTVTGGSLKIGSRPAFVAADKYLVVDASGNVHVSALGPAS